MPTPDDFLNSADQIDENQAEFSLLSSLSQKYENKYFLLEIEDVKTITSCYNETLEYIESNYKSFEIRLFILHRDLTLSYNVIRKQSGASVQRDAFYNLALTRSRETQSFILLCTPEVFALVRDGGFDESFANSLADKKRILEAEGKKLDIDQLEEAFEHFHVERKHNGCDYIKDGKVSDDINEQQLRNQLIQYLVKATNMMVHPEFCTSRTKDEESVDVSVIDKNNLVAIIEVKFIVAKKFYVTPERHRYPYSFSRFKDGYEQLNRYYIDLEENYQLHSAYLYMFYAHSMKAETIKEKAKIYYQKFETSEECSDIFRQHYKTTVFDDMVDMKGLN